MDGGWWMGDCDGGWWLWHVAGAVAVDEVVCLHSHC